MSADSSDCHPSSSSVVVGAEAPSTSAKISVICHMSQQPQTAQNSAELLRQSQQHSTNPSLAIESSAASSTTPGPQVVMGRSHLENALKLPPNTSVATYYQNTKLLNNSLEDTAEQQTMQNCAVYPTNVKQEYNNSPSQSSQGGLNYSRTATGTSSAPVTDMDTVPTGAANPLAAASSTSSSSATHIKMSPSPPCPTSTSSAASNGNHLNPSVIYNNSLKQQTPTNNSLILSQVLQQQHSSSINPSNYQHHNNNNNNNIVVSTTESSSHPQMLAHHMSPYDSFGPPNGPNSNTNSSSSPYHPQPPTNAVIALHHSGPPTTLNNNSIYHHQQHHQQPPPHHLHPHHAHSHTTSNGQSVMVVAADSRPQTPDYIKSYPVMDTTVASSMKGEPELNIGKRKMWNFSFSCIKR